VQKVTLRKMTLAEYEAAAKRREPESIRALSKFMPEGQARHRARQGTVQFLPGGLDTAGHHLVVAENESGEAVRNAWIGPDSRQASGTIDSAWIYDINVFEPFRRRGYGSAILAAVEDLVACGGKTRLALNVVGDDAAAIALYRRNGYAISSMFLDKDVTNQRPPAPPRS